jgi:hypothetical protein
MGKPRTDTDRLEQCSHIFDGRDEDIRARTTVIVTTRASHECLNPNTMKYHKISAGTRAMREHAIVDGVWGTSYSCVECLDAYMDAERI